MLNHVWPREELEERTVELASTIAERGRFPLALTKMAINQSQDAAGFRVATDSAFALHELAHVQNLVESQTPNQGKTAAQTRDEMRADEDKAGGRS